MGSLAPVCPLFPQNPDSHVFLLAYFIADAFDHRLSGASYSHNTDGVGK
ncbi:hypothetical protein F2S74_08950 [Pseudomonas syringae pv. actinidiae]|nr:hypothetical protein [Pseudomonas syringae pv. actinidiae]NVL42757.1 hypothetical protein [Pseudomonas syringae pv. actinidiae]